MINGEYKKELIFKLSINKKGPRIIFKSRVITLVVIIESPHIDDIHLVFCLFICLFFFFVGGFLCFFSGFLAVNKQIIEKTQFFFIL